MLFVGKCVHVYFYVPLSFCGKKVIRLMQTRNEAMDEAELMNNVYAEFAENFMAIPVIKGLKN